MARYMGFREAAMPAGLSDARVAHGDFSEADGTAGMKLLLDEHRCSCQRT
jgi:DNA-binding LacI/PurR family transcriptional regulator